MPLSAPTARQPIHKRTYEFNGYQRSDGLWDIEGRIVDTKSYGFANQFRGRIEPGEALHDMSVRLTIDEDLVVRDIEATTDDGPYPVCPRVAPNFKRMIGARVGRGWRREIVTRVGGIEGCTHIVEMLGAMATVAFQTLYPVIAKKRKLETRGGRPAMIESCHAYRLDGEVVRAQWPEFYDPDAYEPKAEADNA